MNTYGEITLTEYRTRVGQVLGLSEWLDVSQRCMGQPLEVAQGILFLASDESGFVPSTELVVDGGYLAQ
jgi:NAD(P)-dependent dehydrogenase (short-subunit alcohol dehydrogenase family)